MLAMLWFTVVRFFRCVAISWMGDSVLLSGGDADEGSTFLGSISFSGGLPEHLF